MTDAWRGYGRPPYTVALVHGGPGATGDLADLAHALSDDFGVIEPLQGADTIDGQADELSRVLCAHAAVPVTIVGHSWGAWLAVIAAARMPAIARKLVLVGAGPFDAAYVPALEAARRRRLSREDELTLVMLQQALETADDDAAPALQARFFDLITRADAYDPLPADGTAARFDAAIHRRVMPAARALRAGGGLIDAAARLACPVVAIHGDHDPHPAAGVREPLARVVADFRFEPIARSGHYPWRERQARDAFLSSLRRELAAV